MRTFYCLLSMSMLLFASLTTAAGQTVYKESDEDDEGSSRYNPRMFNFASHASGAVILDKSPASAKGYSNLLIDNKDKYGIAPCAEKKWVVIGLSEDIVITAVALANYEKYSSPVKDFQLLAAAAYPTQEWLDLGTYTAKPQLGEQLFNITQSSHTHTRYLKVKLLTHYQQEALCTLSQIKVFGVTVIASLQEEVGRFQQQHVSFKDILKEEEERENRSEPVLAEKEALSHASTHTQTERETEISLASENRDVSLFVEESEKDKDTALSSASHNEDTPSVEEKGTIDTPTESILTEEDKESITTQETSLSGESVQSNEHAHTTETVPSPALTQTQESTQESESDVSSLTRLAARSHNADELAQTITIAGTSLSVEQWKQVQSVFVASQASQGLLSRALLSLRDLFDVNSEGVLSLRRLEKFLFAGSHTETSSDAHIANDSHSNDIRHDSEDNAERTKDSDSDAVKESEGERVVVPPIAAPEENGVVSEGVNESGTIITDNDSYVSETAKDKETVSAPAESVACSHSHTNTTSDNETPSPVVPPNDAAPPSVVNAEPPASEESTETSFVFMPAVTTTVTKIVSAPSSANDSAASVSTNNDDADISAEDTPSPTPSGTNTNTFTNTNTNAAVPTPTALTASREEMSEKESLAAVSESILASHSTSLHCFELLHFDDFQEKMLAKLQSLKTQSHEETVSSLHRDRDHNVFKLLVEKIKTLEQNAAISEMYIEQLTSCFKFISKESLIQFQHNAELQKRVDSLEQVVQQLVAQRENATASAAASAETATAEDSSLRSADELHLLKYVKEPALDQFVGSVEDVFHRLVYEFLRLLKSIKSQLAVIKQSETFNKIFHRSHALKLNATRAWHGKEAREEFLSTHTSFEIAREYAVELFLAFGVGLAVLFVISSILLGLFLGLMWLLYNSGSK